jgi:hypothetical protein
MAWVRIDDQLHAHPKIRHAWRSEPASLGLHLLALSYVGAYLTDGNVPAEFVSDQLPGAAKRNRAVKALEEAGLWERNGTGWTIHDYLDFNESRAKVLAKRRADANRKRAVR